MKVCRNPLYVSQSSRSTSSHSIPNIVELPALASLELRDRSAIVISSVWSSKIRLPAQVDMTKWINEHYIAIDKPQLRYPHDIDYLNEMLRWAEEGEGNAGSGMNKTNFPVQWSEAKRWWRQQVPFARKAFRDLGELRFAITTMKMLGFEYTIKNGTAAI